MKNITTESMTPNDVVRLLSRHRRLWLIPTILGGVLGVAAAFLMPRYWEASQAFIVRETATGGEEHQPGRFASLSAMKTLQETVLELAKSKSVAKATLKEVGPSSGSSSPSWPSDRVIDDFRKQVKMAPPGGAEFGMTEVFYLAVRSKGRDRALKLVSSLSRHLDKRFRALRDNRAQGMIAEMKDATAIAEENLAQATRRLGAFEAEVGADLIELRILQTSPSASSDLRQKLVAAENAKRLHETQQQQDEQLLTLLRAARKDPGQLIATPNLLLESQPALRRLKDGLVDAQLLKAQLMGTRSNVHPEVLAAQEVKNKIQANLHSELDSAIQGLEVNLRLNTSRVAAIDGQLADGRTRFERLAQSRAEYANLVTLTENRRRLAEIARSDLSEAREGRASARAASLIQPIDGPETGVNPVGPGRTVVAGAGGIGGFVFGMGLLFLLAETPAGKPREAMEGSLWPQTPAVPEPSGALETIEVAETPLENETQSEQQVAATTPDASDAFGIFHGLTLHEAARQVATRDQRETANR